MTEKSSRWESFKAEGFGVIDKLKELVHEGNVRRVVIEQHGRTVAEFPLSIGVMGAVLAPVFAAIAAERHARVTRVPGDDAFAGLDGGSSGLRSGHVREDGALRLEETGIGLPDGEHI